MNPSKKLNNGWVLCRSKRFPGRLYYFNVSTGKTAWYSNENEKTSQQSPPIQNEDTMRFYPEPSSPPDDHSLPTLKRTVTFTPSHESTYKNLQSNCSQNVMPHSSNPATTISSIVMQPSAFDSITNSVLPYQIQLPLVWPECHTPQVIMIMMNPNTMRRQFAIEEPKRPPIVTRAPDREILIHTGKAPLCQRFVNYEEPVEFGKNKNTPEKQIVANYATGKFIPDYSNHQTANQNTGKSELTQNANNYSTFREPVFRFTKEPVQNYDPKYKFAPNTSEKKQSNTNEVLPGTSSGLFGARNWPHQNISMPVVLKQSQNYESVSGQSQNNQSQTNEGPCDYVQNETGQDTFKKAVFTQSQIKQVLFGQTQIKEVPFGQGEMQSGPMEQRQKNQEVVFGKCQSTNEIIRQNQKDRGLLEQQQYNQDLFDKNQTYKNPFRQNQIQHRPFERRPNNHEELFRNSQSTKELFRQIQRDQDIDQTETCQDLSKQVHQTICDQSPKDQDIFDQKHSEQSQTLENRLEQSETMDNLHSNNFESPYKRITEKSVQIQSTNKYELNGPSFKGLEAKSTLTPVNNVDSTPYNADLENLDETDLRRILLARKRKSDVLSAAETLEGNKIKITKQESIVAPAPKKMVSFNLIPETFSDGFSDIYGCPDGEDMDYMEAECAEGACNEDISPPESGVWYVVSDTNSLLEHYEVLKDFVKSDLKCNLMIPSQVMSDTVAVSRGKCSERHYVTLARHLLRELATPQPHVIVQPSYEEAVDVSTSDSVLNCCLEIMRKSYVVLVTNDEELRSKANSRQINCFTIEQIKNAQKNKQKVKFDIKKVKISVTNDTDNVEIPSESFENLKFGSELPTLTEKNLDSNSIVSPLTLNSVKNTNEPKSNRSLNDFIISNANQVTNLQTRNDNVASFSKLNSNPKIDFSMPKSNETESDGRYIVSDTHNPLSFQNDKIKDQKQIASIFKEANEKLKNKSVFEFPITQPVSKKGSIFDIDGIETTKSQKQSKNGSILENIFKAQSEQSRNTIFKSNCPTKKLAQHSQFETEIKLTQLKPSIFDKETTENQPSHSIFEKEIRDNQWGKSNFDKVYGITDMEADLEKFYANNEYIEHLIERSKEGIVCSFKQIMEECLTHVLEDNIQIMKDIYKESPPYTLEELLKGLKTVYREHPTVRVLVAVFTSVLNARAAAPARDVVRCMWSGLALVKYLKSVTKPTEQLLETEEALNIILEQARMPLTDIEPSKAPAYSADDLEIEKRHRRNFVKDRSDVLQYLKRHYAAWANYDETQDTIKSTAPCGRNYKDAMIVRTCGRNLNKVNLNNSKPMTINEPDSSQNVEETLEMNKTRHENLKRNVTFDKNNNNDTDLKVKDNILKKSLANKNLSKNMNEMFGNPKLTRVVKNTTAETQRTKMNDENERPLNLNNEKIQTRQTEPKVIKLFKDLNLTARSTEKSEESVFDDFITRGHFGTMENGPKVLRSIKPIKEFEEKLNSLNLDKKGYLGESISNDENDLNNHSTDIIYNNTPRMCIDDKQPDTQTKAHLIAKNYGKINQDAKYDDSDAATNNENFSMSLDNCVTNNIYGTIDIDELIQSNDVINTKHYMINSTNDMMHSTNDTNINSDPVSFSTNEIDTPNSKVNVHFKTQSLESSETGVKKYVQKDDVTIDSGFENASLQAHNFLDSFFIALKDLYKRQFKFIKDSLCEVRDGPLSVSRGKQLHDSALSSQGYINQVMVQLERIIHREKYGGPRAKDVVQDAGCYLPDDDWINNYGEFVTQLYGFAKIIKNALTELLALTDDSRIQ